VFTSGHLPSPLSGFSNCVGYIIKLSYFHITPFVEKERKALKETREFGLGVVGIGDGGK